MHIQTYESVDMLRVARVDLRIDLHEMSDRQTDKPRTAKLQHTI